MIGDGTLKLKNGSNAYYVLAVSGDHNLVSGIRIDGNAGGSPTGAGRGLSVSGHYNHILNVAAFNTKAVDTTATFNVYGTHNLLEGCWSEDAGGAAFFDAGDYNRYQDSSAKNWGDAGFHRWVNTDFSRLDIDGCHFEPGAASASDNCLVFDGSVGTTQMVAIRNTIVDWTVAKSGTPVLGKFARIDWLILDNCLFRHSTIELTTLEIGANVKRAQLDHCFLSRQLKLNAIDSDAIVMLVDTQIGDDQLWTGTNTQPSVSVEGVGGAQFIARTCRFIGYNDAALDVPINIAMTSTFVHFEAADTEFQGRKDNAPTYDVRTSGSGAISVSRKLLWLNNRRSNTGTNGTADTIATVNARVLFTTRDWSKRVLEDSAAPPTNGGIIWLQGDTVMHTAPTSPNGNIGWVYIASLQQWKSFGTIS